MSDEDGYIDTLAELAVAFGANVQPGQIVAVSTEPGKERLTRAVAEAAYARGAKYVDVSVFDLHVKHSRLRHAPKDTLTFVPPWLGARARALGEAHAALIGFTGPVAPQLMADIDPELLGLDLLPRLPETGEIAAKRLVNWTVIPCPTPGWASIVHPQMPVDDALARLWREIAHICRLREPDPAAAWAVRLRRLEQVGETLNGLELDSLEFEGPGTDLKVGLLPGSRWISGRMTTTGGIVHAANVPTEEVFTAPDPERVDGTVSSTKPLFVSGGIVTGLRVRFESGRAVEIDADTGAATVQALSLTDAGAARLGEVALVDRESRIGELETVFFDTLIDENAASHIALGRAYPFSAIGEADLERINHSQVHLDFMIGSTDVAVTGVRAGGQHVPLLRGGEWQI